MAVASRSTAQKRLHVAAPIHGAKSELPNTKIRLRRSNRKRPQEAKPQEVPRRPSRRLRCAIYTRKSSDEGLEQAFNSLDAQREACAAFVLSQKHEGWTARRPCMTTAVIQEERWSALPCNGFSP